MDCGQERRIPGGKILTGKRTLYYGTLAIYRGKSDEEMAARLVAFARDIAMQRADGYIRIRAGAVVHSGRAMILPSLPNQHLPGLVALLVRGGAPYLGDDVTYIEPVMRRVYSTGLPIRLDAEDLRHFPDLEREPVSRRRRRPSPGMPTATPRRLLTPEEIGGSAATDAPIGWIIFPSFEEGSDSRLEPLGGAEALFRFTQGVLNLNVWTDRALLLMRELLDEVPVSKLTVGSLPDAAALLLEASPNVLGEVTT